MSNSHIDRAIWLAGKIAHAEATGQPNLAALYEKNVLQEIQAARREVRQERIKRNPFLKFQFFAEDVGLVLTDWQKYWLKANPRIGLKLDYALAGPSKGSGS